MTTSFALIIGSGFDTTLRGERSTPVATRFGEPSAAVSHLTLGPHAVLSLARHGDAHSIPPHAINYRANLAALRELGATAVIALNTVGVVSALRDPGEIAVPDQVLDYTWGREHTIFDGSDGVVEHLDFTEPFTAGLRAALLDAAAAAAIDCCDGGVYAATQGPRLETAAEIDRLERDGADYVGMTAMPEAIIARELGMDYACLALIVNRAAGRGDIPIHDDLEASTAAARSAALATLRQFFSSA